MNTIDKRLERLLAKLSDAKKNTREELRVPPCVVTPAISGLRHFYVRCGNVAVIIAEPDQNAAAISFSKLMVKGLPFENSILAQIFQIKDLKSHRNWYAYTETMLSAAAA